MTPTPEQLLSIAREYWRPDRYQHLTQEPSPEAHKLEARWREALQKVDRWHAFLTDLKQVLPDFTIGDGTATPDACFRCVAYPVKGRPLPPFDWVVVGCISILAPVYMVYGVEFEQAGKARLGSRVSFEPLPPQMRSPADIFARKIEETFGVSALPREVAEIPVPLVVE
ncbi:hypothetical protein ATI61_10664 [Archangium gephyra]|uniref:Uncharacterized protein n=1 Tax=Archangium gephyra TaxID=48 RepID=A0AAC8Q0F5_9BACT|nr:hypothetical protein [Archangium gephyra]AKI98667.1 Hypothetical protein AA314_00294 [Archangium gephyra]REG30595.1 hypothetical protein ATI61_10664 [Archangium gephyra]